MTRKQEKPRHSLHHGGRRGICHFCICFSVFVNAKPAAPPVSAQPACCRPGFVGYHPPLGGASRAPGLPQAAAWRICGRSPHPLREESRTTTGRPPVAAVSALCAGFGVEVEEVVPVEGIWTALGRVWGGGCPGHSNSEKERLHGPLFGPFGGVRFSY